MRFGAARPHPGGKVLGDTVRNEKRRILRPSVDALREADFLVTERLAVGRRRALSVGRAVPDAAVEDDERGPALGLLKDLQRMFDAIDVVGVAHAQHVPPVGEKPGGDVLGERQVGAPLDGDVVVVPDPTQVVQAQVAGERCRLGTDAFHQTAVTADRIGVVVEDLEAGAVVTVGKPAFADRHPHAGRDALPQRAGGGLHTRHHAVFRMPRSLAAKLTKMADVIERDRRIAQALVVGIHGPRPGEVEHRPEQHRGVAVREHEAIAAGPDRIYRIEAHDAIPERVDQWRQRHRCSGVTGIGCLNRIYRQRPNGVDGELIDLRTSHGGCSHGCWTSSLRPTAASIRATFARRRRCRSA